MRIFFLLFILLSWPALAQEQAQQPEIMPSASVMEAVQDAQAEQKAAIAAKLPPGSVEPTPTVVPGVSARSAFVVTPTAPTVPANPPPPVAASVPSAIQVPEISFGQKVDMVVTAKHDPRILDVKIDQVAQKVIVSVVVDKNQDRQEVKELAQTLMMQIKSKSLDDPPKNKKEIGKGLYDYQVDFTRPDGVQLLSAYKPAKETKIMFENPDPVIQPATRAGASGL